MFSHDPQLLHHDTAMASDTSTALYVGISRSVLALDATTGAVRWTTELPGSAFSAGFVSILADGGHVYASTAGEVTCLDAATGAVRWHNALPGYGIGFVTLATGGGAGGTTDAPASDTSAAAASYTAAASAAAAAGGVAATL